jgi:ABC-type branched-subunit amino acid transport system ATPase component
VVLDYGRKLCEGGAEAVRNDPRVIEAYLGSTEHT